MMNELAKIRTLIDALDQTIMESLETRFSLMKEVALIKQQHKIKTVDRTRELAILAKAEAFVYAEAIKAVYEVLMNEAKKLQQ
jgi:chorismate mutase